MRGNRPKLLDDRDIIRKYEHDTLLSTMITFKSFLIESIAKLSWNSNPSIGWWEDQKKLRLYHGTALANLESISKSGLDRMDPKTGMISLAFEPFTANAFAVMGGEARFLMAKSKALTVPKDERITLVFDIPQIWIDKHRDPDLRGNDVTRAARLRDHNLYKEWDSTDQQYYQLAELRVNAPVPAKFLTGYMKRN